MARNMEHGIGRGRNRWSWAVWGGAAALLSLPLIAMQFTSEVDWSGGDFLIMGVLLAIVCAGYEIATRLSDSRAYRAGAAVAIGTGFLTIWVNMAVGMLGSENNPANLLFGLVLLTGMAGALIAGFKPMGMARAMYAAAAAQTAMTLFALFGGYIDVVLHIGCFVLPWLLSALLFKKAAQEATP